MTITEGYRFPDLYLDLSLALCSIGWFLNLVSSVRIYLTFKVSKALYLILFIDGLVSTFLLGETALTFPLVLVNPNSFQTDIGCHFLAGGMYIGIFVGPFFGLQISSVRLYIAKKGDLTNNQLVVKTLLLSFITAMLSFLALQVYSYMGAFLSGPLSLCKKGPDFNANPNPIIFPAIGMFHFVNIILTIVFDTMTFKHINVKVSDENGRKKLLEIPLRATILSSGIGLSTFVISVLATSLLVDKTVPSLIILMFAIFVVSARHPLIAALAFKVNHTNQAISNQKLREDRRKLEIQHAITERKNRQKRHMDACLHI